MVTAIPHNAGEALASAGKRRASAERARRPGLIAMCDRVAACLPSSRLRSCSACSRAHRTSRSWPSRAGSRVWVKPACATKSKRAQVGATPSPCLRRRRPTRRRWPSRASTAVAHRRWPRRPAAARRRRHSRATTAAAVSSPLDRPPNPLAQREISGIARAGSRGEGGATCENETRRAA